MCGKLKNSFHTSLENPIGFPTFPQPRQQLSCVTYVSERVLPMYPVHTIAARRGGRAIKKISRSISLSRGRGGFPIESTMNTTPSARATVASQHLLDRAATPPRGDARRGIAASKLHL